MSAVKIIRSFWVGSGAKRHPQEWREARRKETTFKMALPLQKTKIVATIGPASSSPPVLERMIHAGMSVARLNFSHGEFAAHADNITAIRAAAKAVGRPVAIMADLPGPKMRIGNL